MEQKIGEGEKRSNLTIISTQPSDAGTYGCVAVNEPGTTVEQATLTVQGETDVQFQWYMHCLLCTFLCFIYTVVPSILFPPVNLTYVVNETDPVIFMCLAAGIPPPEITWIRNGVPLDDNVDPHISLSNLTDPDVFPTTGGNIYSVSRNMTISNSRDNDSDTYICVVFNGNARTPSVTRDFELVVQSM